MNAGNFTNTLAYDGIYRTQFQCGESDVHDSYIGDAILTDIYLGTYYITPERLLKNKFTIPYSPPMRATLGMMGAVTHVRDIHDLAKNFASVYSVCAFSETAYMDKLLLAFPELDIRGISYHDDLHQVFSDGTCDILISPSPELAAIVRRLSLNGQCLVNGMVSSIQIMQLTLYQQCVPQSLTPVVFPFSNIFHFSPLVRLAIRWTMV